MLRRAFSMVELLVVIAAVTILAGVIFPVLAQARDKGRQSRCLSNIRQIGQALLIYAQDFDESLPPSRQTTGGNWPCTGIIVRGSQWNKVILPYVKNEQVFACPADPVRSRSRIPPRSYVAVAGPPILLWGCTYLNGVMGPGWGSRLAEIPAPASMALAYERFEGFTVEDALGVHANLWGDWCVVGPQRVAYPRKSRWFSFDGPTFDGPHAGGGSLVFCDGHARWLKYDQTKAGGDRNCRTPATASLFDRRHPM
jgi:prepilin-type N-terminal cleavage/methylation domain-containing protein/prepilin-type processing-associated H-X9-DG protein